MRIGITHEAQAYNRSRTRIQAIRIRNRRPTGVSRFSSKVPQRQFPPAPARSSRGPPPAKFRPPERSNGAISRAVSTPAEITVALCCKFQSFSFTLALDSAGLAVPCTFACAIASPIGNSSKRPPRSLPSRKRGHSVRSRNGSPTNSEWGLDAGRAGNSRSILSSGRRRDGAWSCCPTAWWIHPDSECRRPSDAALRSSALLLAARKPQRPGEIDADAAAGIGQPVWDWM